MSYILDALRKADAQRERDPARGIHAQPVTLSGPADNSAPASRVWLVGMALVAGAALLAAALWRLGWLDSFSRSAAPTATAVLAPTVAPIAKAVPPMTPQLSPATELFPAAPPTPPPPAAPPARESPKSAATVTAYPPVPVASAGDRLPSLVELPADVQRELPKLTITGGVYSPTPAQRLLIVNGQVLGEGAEAAPGVLLEQIRPKTAVLNFRGYRYGVAY